MAGLDPAIYAFSGLPMIVQLQNLIRTYKSDSESLTVLNGASLALNAGEIVALVAPSGAG